MKKKTTTKSTSNQQTHLTQTPTNPEWSTKLVSGLAGDIDNLGGVDPNSLVAGADPLQSQAGAGAAGLTVSPNFDRASELWGAVGSAGPTMISGDISGFLNPYLKNVVDTSLADFDFGAGRQEAQANLDLANDTTFGGSGGALFKSALGGEIARGRGALSAGLRSSAYDKATQLAVQQAALREQALARQGQAATGLANVGQVQGAEARSNVDQQASIGDMLRQITAAQKLSPLTLLGTRASLAGSLPLGMFTGQTQDGTMDSTSTSKTTVSDPMGSIGGLLAGAGSLAMGLGTGGLGLSFGAGSLMGGR